MAGSLALVNAFLPNNSRQPRGGERKRGGRRAKFNPSSPLQPSFFFFFFFLARLSRPSMPPLPLPFFLRWNRSLPSRVHARRKNTSWPWAAARRIKMRGTLVLRTAFNVATHDETRGFIIYISSEMKVDGRGGAETRKSGGERSARQFFRRCCFVKNDWFYDWRFFLFFEIKRIWKFNLISVLFSFVRDLCGKKNGNRAFSGNFGGKRIHVSSMKYKYRAISRLKN